MPIYYKDNFIPAKESAQIQRIEVFVRSFCLQEGYREKIKIHHLDLSGKWYGPE